MHKITSFTPPSAGSLELLMKQLGCTNGQMAALSGVKDGNQWRKYTGINPARTMSIPAAFYLAAQLALSQDEYARVLEEMRKIGADVKAEMLMPGKL